MLLIAAVTLSAFADNDSYIGIRRFTINSSTIDYYQSIDVLLFQRLNFELLPHGVKPILIHDSIPSECIAMAGGSVELVDSVPFLFFEVRGVGTTANDVETKKISLQNQPVDAIVDILALKIRHFLEQNVSGKLRISSKPLDCEILLNGVKIGKTPADLILENGTYAVQMNRDHFAPFVDSAVVLPGRETSLSATMEFRGYNVRPWLLSAVFLTLGTVTVQIVEAQLHHEYLDAMREDEFNKAYDRYEITNAIKIVMLIPTVTAWTMSGYLSYQNNSLKKSIFSN